MDLCEQTLIVTEQDLDVRLDKLLSIKFPEYSRTYFQSLIAEGNVLVNGALVKKRERLREGDEIEVCFVLTPELSLEPEDLPLDVLYEDEDLIAINKPPGMVVHPAPGHPRGTFANALLYRCKTWEKELSDPLRPGIVHRLDKDTSGVLVAAKNVYTHRALVQMFAERKVQKRYAAICSGTPPLGEIRTLIGRHPKKRQEMAVLEEGGKPAVTIIRSVTPLKRDLSLVELELVTGRTHQIRVHLRHIGHPVLGDPVYGREGINTRENSRRQLLHAQSLSFLHPRTGIPFLCTAPLPEDMTRFLSGAEPQKNF